MLEAELATICPTEDAPQLYGSNQEQDLHKLRLLLERECAAQVTLTCFFAGVRSCLCFAFAGAHSCLCSAFAGVRSCLCFCLCWCAQLPLLCQLTYQMALNNAHLPFVSTIEQEIILAGTNAGWQLSSFTCVLSKASLQTHTVQQP